MAICAGCETPIINDDEHLPHDVGCLCDYNDPLSASQFVCACDNVTHSSCCWECR